MRKFLLFTALCFCCLGQSRSYAQNTFAPVGAEWWYGGALEYYSAFAGELGNWQWVDHMQSVKDTLVAGKSSRMLAAVRYQKNNGSVSYVHSRDTFFIYNNEDTVFSYNKYTSDFTPLYIFNVNVGDTICMRVPNEPQVNVTFCYVIDSIKTEQYDTSLLKSYYNHTILGTNVSWGGAQHTPGQFDYRIVGKYTEKIGGNWPLVGSFFPAGIAFVDEYKNAMAKPTGTFRCYNDPLTAIKVVNVACDSVFPSSIVGIAAIQKSPYGITLSPNPSSGRFTLAVQKPLSQAMDILVCDLSGRMLSTLRLATGQTSLTGNLDQLSSGAYLLLLQTGAERYYHKLVISK